MTNRFVNSTTNGDGIDRRGFLECMAWVGTGVAWAVSGGVLTSRVFGQEKATDKADFTFVQISDSHIGFAKDPNKDVAGTLNQTIPPINDLKKHPYFLLHTTHFTHL